MVKGKGVNIKPILFLLIIVFSLGVKVFHMHNERDFHSDKLGLVLNDGCTICHFTILTPLESESISVPKPFLEIQTKEDIPYIPTFHSTTAVVIDRPRGPPFNI